MAFVRTIGKYAVLTTNATGGLPSYKVLSCVTEYVGSSAVAARSTAALAVSVPSICSSSRQQRRSLARIEQPADRVARVDAVDRLREQLAHRYLAHLWGVRAS